MGKQKNILLIEDDDFAVRAYVDGLQRAGFTVDCARDGEEAMQKLENSRPDLVVLDLVMPIMDGFELLKTMKGRDEYKAIPVIVLSNLSQASDIEQAKKFGALDYLVKNEHTLRDVIERIREHMQT